MRSVGFISFVVLAVLPACLKSQSLAHTYNTRVEYSYSVKSVPDINTAYSDFSAIINSGKVYFTSDREYNLLSWGEGNWKKNKHLNVYAAGFRSPSDDSIQVKSIELFHPELTKAFHSGPVCFNTAGDMAIVTIVSNGKLAGKKIKRGDANFAWVENTEEDKNKIKRPQLYMMMKTEGEWSVPARLPFNDYNYSYGHPCFSPDGKTLYFSSDMRGSAGGKDIFSVSYADGKWGTPVNLGKVVNTSGDEVFPYFINDKLYFSSGGHGGLGGLDLFMSHVKAGVFEKPENLGDKVNSPSDDFAMTFSPSGKNGFFSSNRPGGLGADDIYFFVVKETVTVISKNISGRIKFGKLDNSSPVGLTVQLVDESGNLIATAITDKDGRFIFEKLPPDSHYTLKVVSDDPNLILEILNENGTPVAVLMTDKRGSFAFKKLEPSTVGTLAFMTTEESSLGQKEGSVHGQVMHEKLKNQSVAGIRMMLVDESGNMYAETKTDAFGNFSFSKLPTDKNYLLKSMDGGDDLIALIFNGKDEVVAELRKDQNGEFRFRRLNSDLEGSLKMLNSQESELFPKNFTILAGSFVFDLLSTDPRALSFKVYDENEKLLQSGTTDNKGNFILTGLPADSKYLFKLDAQDASLQDQLKLQMLSRYGNETHFITANDKDYFVYDRNQKGSTMVHDEKLPVIPVIYFAKNSSTLDGESMKVLDQAAEVLKKHPEYSIDIHAHADSRASDAFNDVLTERRMVSARNYLISKGIDKKRMKGFYHGKKMLLVKCPDDKCTEEQHKQNRRTEFQFVKN